MNKISKTIISAALAISVAGCAGVSNQDIGVVTGGAVGGALGSLFGSGSGKIVAAVGGTVLGAIIGGAIGRTMDRTDQMRVNQTLENTPSGNTSSWHNPDTGNTYYVTPKKTYYRNKRPCRDFTTTGIIGGKRQTIYGRACRMSDGSWQMVNR